MRKKIPQKTKRRTTNWIGHILRTNCLLKHVTQGKIERDRSDRKTHRRRKQLLDDLKETKVYWELYEEALDRNVCRSRFGRGYGPVIRQNTA